LNDVQKKPKNANFLYNKGLKRFFALLFARKKVLLHSKKKKTTKHTYEEIFDSTHSALPVTDGRPGVDVLGPGQAETGKPRDAGTG
jgi:hypothetical protein